MANFTIVQNTTKYSHKDIMAFIEEMEWYVAKIESYAPNGSPDNHSQHVRHVELSNYASQSLSNRLKNDFVYGAVCPMGGEKCGCDFIVLKLINPERLDGGSAMHMLASGLGGLQKRASRELMADLTRFLSRQLGWGRHQDGTTSSIWRMGWGYDDAYDMASYLQRELMNAGMGVGIEGKDIWDRDKAVHLRPMILQRVLGLLDRHCVDNTNNILHRTTNDITNLIVTFRNVRQGHKDNDTTGSIDAENVTIATLRKLLNELEAVQKGD